MSRAQFGKIFECEELNSLLQPIRRHRYIYTCLNYLGNLSLVHNSTKSWKCEEFNSLHQTMRRHLYIYIILKNVNLCLAHHISKSNECEELNTLHQLMRRHRYIYRILNNLENWCLTHNLANPSETKAPWLDSPAAALTYRAVTKQDNRAMTR